MLVFWGKDRASVRVSVLWRETQTLVLCTKNSVQKIFQRLIGNIRGSRNSTFKECKYTKKGIATGIFRGVLWNFPEYFFNFSIPPVFCGICGKLNIYLNISSWTIVKLYIEYECIFYAPLIQLLWREEFGMMWVQYQLEVTVRVEGVLQENKPD